MDSFRSSNELQFQTCKSGRTKKREVFNREGVAGGAFHWLSCDSLSLATQLPGKEKIFLPPASLPASTCLPVGTCVDLTGICMRPHIWPPDSIFVRFPFIHFPTDNVIIGISEISKV